MIGSIGLKYITVLFIGSVDMAAAAAIVVIVMCIMGWCCKMRNPADV